MVFLGKEEAEARILKEAYALLGLKVNIGTKCLKAVRSTGL